ncbi:MOSC domain-containing protein [Euzebya tangerina]|uniref:MOSC domain-containing protein n=1 Tax=Euzebya tangerina TaxID=591198 RepID=UPI000E30C112|nr:MOSC domain-containing protein [Euzebya tangerina]
MDFPTAQELDRSRAEIDSAPSEVGRLDMVVARPDGDRRKELESGRLDGEIGLIGDNWKTRGSAKTPDGSSDPERQLTLMNTRVVDAISAGDRTRWALAGDQLYVDFNLHPDNVPPGTRLQIGEAVVEITSKPHTGCAKFADRYGVDALRFVNTGEGKEANYRGVNATVVSPGTVRPGDPVTVV